MIPLVTTSTNQHADHNVDQGSGGSIGPTRVRQDARLQRRQESTARLVSPLIHALPSHSNPNHSSDPLHPLPTADQSNYYANAINNLRHSIMSANSDYYKQSILNNFPGHSNRVQTNHTSNNESNNNNNSIIPGMNHQYQHVPLPTVPYTSYYRSLSYKLRNDKQVCL